MATCARRSAPADDQSDLYTWLVDNRTLTAPTTPAFWVVVVRNEYAYE